MTQQIINVGSVANDGAGDPIRTAFQKTNANFTELYSISGITGIANGNSNVSIAANSVITISATGVANVLTISNTAGTLTGNFSATGSILSSSATLGVGYKTGAGGTITQLTNKSTGVTLNTVCGQITMNNASLASDTVVSFTLTNSAIAASDVLVLNHVSGGTAGSYLLNAQAGTGSATINIRNVTSGALAEAIVISFAVVKAVTA